MPRTEQEIFDETAQLCAAPGYVHAITHLSLRDNVVGYSRSMTVKDVQHLFSPQRLLRTEICTLIGLMVRVPVDFTLPEPDVLRQYIERSDAPLAELHQAISEKAFRPEEWRKMLDEGTDPFERGSGLQEQAHAFVSVEPSLCWTKRVLLAVKSMCYADKGLYRAVSPVINSAATRCC